eukprot:766727-Hanusia_phi.AAC.8
MAVQAHADGAVVRGPGAHEVSDAEEEGKVPDRLIRSSERLDLLRSVNLHTGRSKSGQARAKTWQFLTLRKVEEILLRVVVRLVEQDAGPVEQGLGASLEQRDRLDVLLVKMLGDLDSQVVAQVSEQHRLVLRHPDLHGVEVMLYLLLQLGCELLVGEEGADHLQVLAPLDNILVLLHHNRRDFADKDAEEGHVETHQHDGEDDLDDVLRGDGSYHAVHAQSRAHPVEGDHVSLPDARVVSHAVVVVPHKRQVLVLGSNIRPADGCVRKPVLVVVTDEVPDAGKHVAGGEDDASKLAEEIAGADRADLETLVVGGEDAREDHQHLVDAEPGAERLRGAAEVGEPVEGDGGYQAGEVDLAEELLTAGHPLGSAVLVCRVKVDE